MQIICRAVIRPGSACCAAARAAAKDILGGKREYEKMSYAYRQLFGALMTSPQYRAQYAEPKLDIARIDAFAAAMRG